MTLLTRSVAMAGEFGLRRVTACLLAVLLVLTMAVGSATCLLAVLPTSADLLAPPQVLAIVPGQERFLARPSCVAHRLSTAGRRQQSFQLRR